MNAISIVENVNNSLVCRTSKLGAQSWRPINRKAFSELAGNEELKGRALKKAHWNYLQTTAGQLNAAVTSEIAAGRIVLTGVSSNAKGNGGTVKWETADHFSRHETTDRTPKKMTKEDALRTLAEALGLNVSDVAAKLALS